MTTTAAPLNRARSILHLGVLLLLLAGCAKTAVDPPAVVHADGEPTRYDQNSWQELIPEDCVAFFDGCNTCRRSPGTGVAACTRKACAAYTRPYCMDEGADVEAESVPGGDRSLAAQTLRYTCSGNRAFTVSYGAYRSGNRIVALSADEVMFSDPQTQTARRLQRVRSASGERYSDGRMTLFAKGGEAFVKEGSEKRYTDCRRQHP